MPRAAPVHRPYPQAKRVEAPRIKTTALGYNYRWRQTSKRYLFLHPLCVACEAQGRLTPATEVDHITPHKGDQALFWDESNWQPLCRPCHSRKTAVEVGYVSASILPSWIKNLAKPLTVVAGPPAAGKTTYVREHASQRDLVLDLDVIAQEMGIAASRDRTESRADDLALAIRERNDRLADFAHGRTPHPKGWLIATAGSFKQRKFWADMGAEVVVVNPGKVVCRQRVMAEAISPQAKGSRLAAIDSWN